MEEAEFSSSSNLTNASPFASQPHPLALSPYYLLLPLLLYPTFVSLFRNHRLRSTLEKYPYTTRRSFASMSNEDAFYIQQSLAEFEFPFTFEKALQFALFRTYGIPSISKLLVETSQFSEPSTATKRYADTSVLISEFLQYHPTSGRSIEAIGRMNYIHLQYQKSGKISNDDLLYTLSLFAGEPRRWIDRYEWRKLEDFEKCAIGTFWKAIGDAMGIGYDDLKSGGESGGGWVDGLQWLEEVMEWGTEYEKEYMVPDVNNKKTAEETVAILLCSMPSFIKPVGRNLVSALMDDRLRTAMMYDKPPEFYFSLVSTLFTIRRFFIRYLHFPRPSFLRVQNVAEEISKDGNHYLQRWESAPWYVRPTLWNRYGAAAWISWSLGLPVPGDEGGKYWPRGYKIQEIGPDRMRGRGEEYVRESKEKLVAERMKGCPFAR